MADSIAHKNRIIDRILSNKWLVSLIINAAFLMAIVIFCDIKYEVSDDFMIDAALSGAFGNGVNPHFVYPLALHFVLGYVLAGLYHVMPLFSWYFVFQLCICFASLTVIVFIVFDRNCLPIAFVLSCVLFSFFACDLYITMQFTKTAAVACAAGGMQVVNGIRKDIGIRKKQILLGFVLALTGSMLRFQCLYIALAFLITALVFELIENRKYVQSLTDFIKPIVICFGCAAVLLGVKELNDAYWSHNAEYAEFLSYTLLRGSISDIQTELSDQHAQEWERLGLDQTDYQMMRSSGLIDKDIYTQEILNQIAQIRKNYSERVTHSIAYIINKIKDRDYKKYAVIQGLIGLMGLQVLLKPKRVWFVILTGGVAGSLIVRLIYNGRIVYRVECAIFLAAAVCILYGFHSTEKTLKAAKWKHIFTMIILMTALGISLRKGLPVMAAKDYTGLSLEEYQERFFKTFYYSWRNAPERYKFNISIRKPYNKLMEHIKNDMEHYYLVDFATGIQLLYYQHSPWEKIPDSEFEHYSYICGVTMRFPDNEVLWERNGIDVTNPFQSLINDNIYVIDNQYSDIKLAYLQKYYYPDAEKELVDTIDGFQIWKYEVQ